MCKQVKVMTPEEKLELAKQLLQKFDAMCDEGGVMPETEVLVLALYARTSIQERQSLLSGIR